MGTMQPVLPTRSPEISSPGICFINGCMPADGSLAVTENSAACLAPPSPAREGTDKAVSILKSPQLDGGGGGGGGRS